jgi:hypothetical protein
VAGPALAGVIGLPNTFVVLGLLRLLVGGVIYLRG